MDAKVPIGMYVCSAHMVGDISYSAAPTSAVDCYYSFAVDMNSFFFSSHGCVGTPVSAKSPLALMS